MTREPTRGFIEITDDVKRLTRDPDGTRQYDDKSVYSQYAYDNID